MTRHRDRDDERRREPRAGGAGVQACVRSGHRLTVIDLSPRGALVEAARALRPGSHVNLHLETDLQRWVVAARVVRCAVAAIDAEAGIVYRAALAFIETCEAVREALTPAGYGVHASLAGPVDPAAPLGDGLPRAQDETPFAPAGGSK